MSLEQLKTDEAITKIKLALFKKIEHGYERFEICMELPKGFFRVLERHGDHPAALKRYKEILKAIEIIPICS